MNIGDVAELSGLPAKTIRYYESIGLIEPGRERNGYRDFSSRDIHTLKFLSRARGLGFTIEDCRDLLSLYDDRSRVSAEVKRIAANHLERIERKIAELEGIRRTLQHLIASCHGDDRPDCPIIDDLASPHHAAD